MEIGFKIDSKYTPKSIVQGLSGFNRDYAEKEGFHVLKENGCIAETIPMRDPLYLHHNAGAIIALQVNGSSRKQELKSYIIGGPKNSGQKALSSFERILETTTFGEVVDAENIFANI